MLSILTASLNNQPKKGADIWAYVCKHVDLLSVSFLFPTAELTENIQRYYEHHCVHLPICTVTMAVKAACKYCSTVLNVIRIFVPSIFSYVKFKLPSFTVIS
jgi:hypothetical protein